MLLSLLLALAVAQRPAEDADVPCKELTTAAERSGCSREMDLFCKEDHGQASFYNIDTDRCLCREGYRYRTNAGCQPIHERGAGGIHTPATCT